MKSIKGRKVSSRGLIYLKKWTSSSWVHVGPEREDGKREGEKTPELIRLVNPKLGCHSALLVANGVKKKVGSSEPFHVKIFEGRDVGLGRSRQSRG